MLRWSHSQVCSSGSGHRRLHISVDGHVILVAEHDLTAPLVGLIPVAMTLGDEV
jgi:hypothetical protein